MKKVCIAVLFAFYVTSCVSVSTERFTDAFMREELIETSLKRKKLFIATHEWFAKLIDDERSNIEFSDKEDGKIIGDVITDFYSNVKVMLHFNVSLKDKKVRMRITPVKIYFVYKSIFGRVLERHESRYFTRYRFNAPSIEEQRKLLSSLQDDFIKKYTKHLENYNDDF